MNCPFDGTDLKVVNRQGIDIDWCPSCKGLWLERGELDKLLERSEGRDDDDDDDDRYDDRRRGAPMPAPGYQQPAPGYQQPAPGYQQPAPGYQQPGYPPPGYQQPYQQPGYDRQHGHPYKKKKSFLRDMLDFD